MHRQFRAICLLLFVLQKTTWKMFIVNIWLKIFRENIVFPLASFFGLMSFRPNQTFQETETQRVFSSVRTNERSLWTRPSHLTTVASPWDSSLEGFGKRLANAITTKIDFETRTRIIACLNFLIPSYPNYLVANRKH